MVNSLFCVPFFKCINNLFFVFNPDLHHPRREGIVVRDTQDRHHRPTMAQGAAVRAQVGKQAVARAEARARSEALAGAQITTCRFEWRLHALGFKEACLLAKRIVTETCYLATV